MNTELLNAQYVSFTTDIWTSQCNNNGFISLTAHFIDKNTLDQKVYTLSTKHFPSRHTGVNISETLSQLLEEWKIDDDRLHLIVHDNAANMISGLDILDVGHMSCFLHTLQLVIEDALFSQRYVADLISKCRKIVTHFSHSGLACERLKQIQKDTGCKENKLIQDVATRWNSTLYMLERILEQKQALNTYAMEHDIPVLNGYSYTLISNVIRLLKPFEEITNMCSSDKELMSTVIPTVATLKAYLSKEDKDAGVKTMKLELKNSLISRFGAGGNMNLQDSNLQIATFLDPRYKDKFIGAEKDSVMKKMVQELIDIENKAKENDTEEIEDNLGVGDADQDKEKELAEEIHDDFWACFEEAKNTESEDSENDSTASPTRQDCKYFSLKLIKYTPKNHKINMSSNNNHNSITFTYFLSHHVQKFKKILSFFLSLFIAF